MYNQDLVQAQLDQMVQGTEDNKEKPGYKIGKSEKGKKFERWGKQRGDQPQGQELKGLRSDTRDDNRKTTDREISEEIKQEAAKYREAEKRLHEYWGKRIQELKGRGLPIDKEGRVDMANYSKFVRSKDIPLYYSDEKRRKHLATVQYVKDEYQKKEEEYRRTTPQELRSNFTAGKNFEVYSLAVLDKILRKLCLLLQTCLHDDGANKADAFAVNDDGALLAIFDNVADDSGQRYKDKKEQLEKINKEQGGTTLDYGITYDENRKVIMTQLKNIPLFHLSISNQDLRDGISGFETDPDKLSEHEKHFFVEIYHEMYAQTYNLLRDTKLHPKLKDNLKKFQDAILKNDEIKARVEEFERELN